MCAAFCPSYGLTAYRLGDAANKLVLDAQRSEQTGQLRPYADAELRLLLRETRSLHEQVVAGQEVFSQIESDDGQICSMLVAALTMRRNKRAMLIYHAQRIEMLKRLFWRAGGQVGAVLAPDRDERRNMSPSEVDFVRDYARLNADYRAWIMDQGPVDTAGSLEAHPPKELYVQVRRLCRAL